MSTGTMEPGNVRYHHGRRIMMLKKTDHAIVFRGKPDGTIVVEVECGKNGKDGVPTNGGIIATTIATNIFTQEFMDVINNQIAGMTGQANKG